jgi:hypothetical protein
MMASNHHKPDPGRKAISMDANTFLCKVRARKKPDRGEVEGLSLSWEIPPTKNGCYL